MKFKRFMTVMVATMAIVFGMSSCSSDDDDQEAALSAQVVGSYTGPEVIMVMGEESSSGTSTYAFSKASDSSVDMVIPQSGESGMMVIPALPVKNIPLSKVGNSIVGTLASYTGTVTNAAGQEKAYTISNLAVAFEDVPKGKAVAVTFSLKYGTMPMAMETTFTGDKK
jgi:hypothetical protein